MTRPHDPERELEQRYPRWSCDRWPLRPARSVALTRHLRILVDDRLGPAGRRCALAHELVHLDRGDDAGPRDSVLEARLEAEVDRLAAERLIPFAALRTVLQVDQDEHQHAAELGVDLDTLHCRMRHLTASQRAELEDLLGEDCPESGCA